MTIKLNRLTLKNFKGIQDFTLNIKGKNANIYGQNGAGKTTLYDAYLWILFDKDSSNKQQFSIRPKEVNGEDVHFIDTEVIVELDVDSKTILLRKIYSEKRTKKRGFESELVGNETSYWVDDVPMKKGDYQRRISELIDEDIFKLITNPLYFNTQLSKDERREILMQLAQETSDLDIIQNHADLRDLAYVLQQRSVSDYKKVVNEKIKKLTADRDGIPPRIDELHKSLPEKVDYKETEKKVSALNASIALIDSKLVDASKALNEYKEKQQELFRLQAQLEKIKRAIDEKAYENTRKLQNEKRQHEDIKIRVEDDIADLERRIKTKESEVKTVEDAMVKLRADWSNEHAKAFTEPTGLTCQICGQDLPVEKASIQIAEMRKKFEKEKAAVLAKINSDGQSKKAIVETLKSEISGFQDKLEIKKKRLIEVIVRLEELSHIDTQQDIEVDYNSDSEYSALKDSIAELQDKLNKPIEDTTSDILQEKQKLTAELDGLNKVLNSRDIAEKTNKRIEELRQQEREFSKQIGEYEHHKFLIEEFIRTKTKLLEEQINKKFKYINFRLFNVQQNGGIQECCEATVNGVPFSDANHAATINAGLDIINTLTNFYKVSAPIFIDNRESVNEIIYTGSQIINLIVSKDQKLRVETANEE